MSAPTEIEIHNFNKVYKPPFQTILGTLSYYNTNKQMLGNACTDFHQVSSL